MPDNEIARMIVRELGHPIITTSLHDNEDHLEYITEPASIHERYEKLVDIVIDGGTGGYHLSTVIDCSGEEPIIIREGIGKIDD